MVTVLPKSKKDKQTMRNVAASTKAVKKGIRRSLFEIGRENQTYLRNLILDKNKNGRIYVIRGKLHQASAPGEAPANLSGGLQKSVDFNVRGSTEMAFGEKKPYGKYLERGTSRMAARPHVGRTVKERGNQNRTIFADSIHTEIKKNAGKNL